jgi:GT2 family glycosyltransferase
MITKVAILIPVHNRLEYTRKCIPVIQSGIKAQGEEPPVNYSIVVVDDGSSDGTDAWIRNNHPEVTLLKGDGSLWWSGSVKKGASHAIEKLGCHWILLWNNDIIPENEYFSTLSNRLHLYAKNTIIGSKICDLHDPEKIWSMGGFFNPKTGKKYMLGLDKKLNGEKGRIIESDWLTGMGTLIPGLVFRKIGYWNEKDFPQYFGDMDFTYRAKLSGFRLMVDPGLVLYNDTKNTGTGHEQSTGKLLRSLVHLRSKYNFPVELKFYRMHAKSPLAYIPMIWKYIKYIGGFAKWKTLGWFGISKSRTK